MAASLCAWVQPVAWPAPPALLSASTQIGDRPERSRLNLALHAGSGLYHLPVLLAQSLGFFAQEGLNVSIEEYPSSTRVAQALQSGAADVASAPFEVLTSSQGKNWNALSIALHSHAPQVVLGVKRERAGSVKSVAGLKGLRIGISAPGSPTYTATRVALMRAGLEEQDASLIAVGSPAAAAHALRAGQVDALAHMDPLMTQLVRAGELVLLCDTRSVDGTQKVFGGPMPGACLMVPIDANERSPRMCLALVTALVHSLNWLQAASGKDFLGVLPESLASVDKSLLLSSFANLRGAYSPDGLVSGAAASTAWQSVARVENGNSARRADHPRTYTNEFATRAHLALAKRVGLTSVPASGN